jgi:soluble lytic murein transglycosylase-like protein
MMIRTFFPAAAALLAWASPALAQQADARPSSAEADDASAAVFELIEHRTAAAQSSSVAPADPPVMTLSGSRAAPPRGRDRFLAFIRAAELRHALPNGLLDALIAVESAYQPGVVSRAGAMGLAQLMPATARALGVLDPFDARMNVDGGARFLRAMLDKFGSVTLALAAYNAGPAAVMRAGGIPANSETPAYVRKVLSTWRLGSF